MESKHIAHSVHRVLLSEVLPYELPFFFSFRGFYNIADRSRMWIDKDGCVKSKSVVPRGKNLQDALIKMLNECKNEHTSFTYGINKNGKENGRKLVLPHPYTGLLLVEFYRKYAGFMLNSCSRSNYSLRYPHHVAQNVRKAYKKSNVDTEEAALTPKNYFYYVPYKNINYFYESDLFQRLEGRYKYLFQTDMKHCFDNIPSERIAEAVYMNVGEDLKDDTFANDAYLLMKDMNCNRNGLAIGSEFSRIFAEIILQRIDSEIEARMSNEGYYQMKDYACFRYVDDTFLFYNEEKVKKLFIAVQEIVLNSWGISINHEKEQNFNLPQISPISVAKEKISQMLDDMLKWRLETAKGITRISQGYYDVPLVISSHKYIQTLKEIISPEDITIDKLTSFLLSQLKKRLKDRFKKLTNIISEYREADNAGLLDSIGKRLLRKNEIAAIRFLCELVKFVFFVFKIDMRMSTSIKVVSIIDMIIYYVNNELFKGKCNPSWKSLRNELYQTIQDEIIFILKNNTLKALSGLEICNILSIMNDLPSSFAISNDVIMTFIDHKFDETNTDVNFLMAFAILKSLKEPNILYGKEHLEEDVQGIIVSWLLKRLSLKDFAITDAESFYIIAGLMPLKTVNAVTKQDISDHFKKYNVSDLSTYRSLFMQWRGTTLHKAIEEKFAVDVY